jgi:hypothetical protein
MMLMPAEQSVFYAFASANYVWALIAPRSRGTTVRRITARRSIKLAVSRFFPAVQSRHVEVILSDGLSNASNR